LGYSKSEYDLMLGNLRKLAIADATPDHLQDILNCAPLLEDLEFYWWQTEYYKDSPDIGGLLQLVSPSIKLFCLSYQPPTDDHAEFDSEEAWIIPYLMDFPPIWTLRAFEQLEELMLDCQSIYGGIRQIDLSLCFHRQFDCFELHMCS
jgi:hypothetical protein